MMDENINNQTKDALLKIGISELNALQNESISLHKKETNIVIYSPTGSGKTVAYLLPVLAKLKKKESLPQVIIIVPARELAIQISEVFKSLQTEYKTCCCYGGHSVQVEKNSLSQSATLIVGTPGRLAYHLRNGNLESFTVSHLIFDEFDKSLEFGFIPDIQEIISNLPAIKSKTLTSATRLKEIPSFLGMKNHAEIDLLESHKKNAFEYFTLQADWNDKLDLLAKFIPEITEEKSIVFCNHRDAVDRISAHLQDMKYPHSRFHGGMKQEEREQALIMFRNGSRSMLLTTDLAARGLDIPEIKNIIHYQLPSTEEAYTHRNGRTARMNTSGKIFICLKRNEELPEFITERFVPHPLPEDPKTIGQAEWTSLYIDLGKKDKVNKIDIVGFICKKGALEKEDIGLIEVMDFSAIVAVKTIKIPGLINKLNQHRIKNKKVKVATAK